MTYDPLDYWERYGGDIAGPGAASPEHERQEKLLRSVLKGLRWSSVFELGPGLGRVTSILRDLQPGADYTAVDLGSSQVAAVRRIWPEGVVVQSTIEAYDPDGQQWDLVLTSEVLMHIAPDRVSGVVDKLWSMTGRALVAVEWDPTPEELLAPISEVNWPHDYRALLAPTDIHRTDHQAIFVKVRP